MTNNDLGDPLDDPAATGNPLKWTVRFAGVLYQGTSIANLAADRFTLTLAAFDIDIGPNVISYTNAPSDIHTVSGRPLPAVNGYPI